MFIEVLRPRALKSGDRIAVVAPASPFAREELENGVAELAALGFEGVYDDSVFERRGFVAGEARLRAESLIRALRAPDIAGLIAVRGGYGSAQLLPHLDPAEVRRNPKVMLGYSDVTALLNQVTLASGVVTFHGPMLEGRLAKGVTAYDRATLIGLVTRPEPYGPLPIGAADVVRPGEAAGVLLGGTLTQLLSGLGTPWAFAPPPGHVLFIDETGERPYRLDRMLTQLRQAGLLERAASVVFNELPGCDEPCGLPTARDVVTDLMSDFPGPVLFGVPSGHTPGAAITLPLGVRVRVVARGTPQLIVEEAAVA
jgi:muramoyltetrapeptide carboxypeptidase